MYKKLMTRSACIALLALGGYGFSACSEDVAELELEEAAKQAQQDDLTTEEATANEGIGENLTKALQRQ